MTTPNPALDALRRAIHEQAQNDPHIAAKIAAQSLLNRSFSILQDDRGVHVESVFALRVVYPSFAADRGIDLRQEGGRDL